MYPVYLFEQGAKIRVENQCIKVEKETEKGVEVLYKAPIGTVSQVILFGNISITTPAIALFLEKEIDVVFLSSSGKYRGRLVNSATPHVALRRAQYLALEDAPFVRSLSVSIIRAKLQHQKALLQRHNRDINTDVIEKDIEKIKRSMAALDPANSLNSLRGTEGRGASAYFEGFRSLFTSEWGFVKREKHPSPDPVNALLSFGYTLLSQNALSAVEITGLDPFAGLLHNDVYNRPSLGLDLMEEFRPIVDGVVLWCCRSGQITPLDFDTSPEENLCWIQPQARKIFVTAFEDRMNSRFTHPLTGTQLSMRQCLIEQARQISRLMQNCPAPPDFVPMGFR